MRAVIAVEAHAEAGNWVCGLILALMQLNWEYEEVIKMWWKLKRSSKGRWMVKTCGSRRFGLGCGSGEGGIPPLAIPCARGVQPISYTAKSQMKRTMNSLLKTNCGLRIKKPTAKRKPASHTPRFL